MVPFSNVELIRDLNLQVHPEGGYFAETGRWVHPIPSPFADGAKRDLGTTIYYLLTPDQPRGLIHRNLSHTIHVLHHGRAVYTLIHPPTSSSHRPRIERITMGTNAATGEVRQLLVSDAWKMSEIPAADLENTQEDHVGCLITEVVVPGFAWDDHLFMTKEILNELFKNDPEGQKYIDEFEQHIKSD